MKLQRIQDRIFQLLISLGINRSYYRRIRSMLRVTENLDESAIRQKAQKIMVYSYMKSIVIASLYFLYFKDPVFTLVLFTLSLQTFLSTSMSARDIQIGMKKGLERLDTAFKASDGSIQRATKETLKSVSSHVRSSFEEIDAIVSAPSGEAQIKLDEFSKNTHWIMSLLAKTCDYVKRHGDHVDRTGVSSFQNILRRLQREVHSDFLSGDHVRIRTAGMGIFIISPVFILPLVDKYAADVARNMGTTDLLIAGFYENITGQSVKLFILVLTVIFYGLYLDIKSSSNIFTKQEDVLDFLQDKRWVKRLIARLTPEKDSRKYIRIKRRIIYSGTRRTVEMHVFRMHVFALMGLVAGMSLVASSVITKNHKLLNDIGYGVSDALYERNITGIELMYDKNAIEDITRLEAEVIRELVDMEDPELSDAKTLVKDRNLIVKNEDTAARLLEKANQYGASGRDFAMSMFLGAGFLFAGYMLPDFSLHRKKVVYGERLLYEETMRLRTLVMILKEQQNMSVAKVLMVLEKASEIFHDTLVEVSVRYGSTGGADTAVRLIDEVDYQPFQDLLIRLFVSDSKMDLSEAFDDLDMNLSFAEDERRDKQKAVAEYNVSQINMFASVGMILTMGLYAAFPIMYASMSLMESLNVNR